MKNYWIVLSCLFLTSACVTIAPPAPMMTLGGPETTAKGTTEVGFAVGTAAALFDGGHAGAQGYYGRFRYGATKRFDFGGDIMGAKRNEGLFLSVKSAARFQLHKNVRLEGGFGVADDSDGKSFNGDLALTVGTIKDRTWNYYSSLRWGYAHGLAGNVIFADQTPDPSDTIVPPNTHFAIINLGAQGKISDNQRFIFEGGYGYVFPKGFKRTPSFYLSVGMVFNLGVPVD